MSHSTNNFAKKLSSSHNHVVVGSCKCGTCGIHTRGDKELVEFLTEEIAAEKKGRKARTPTNLDGFDIKFNGSEMTLSKKFNEEIVELTMNLNHSVDAEIMEDDVNAKSDNPPDSEMKSRPQFEVKLIKGSQTTRFACSYIQDVPQPIGDDNITDVFTVDELAVYEGTPDEHTYAVSGDILDGYMYDLIMNLLEERGVSNEFVEKLSDVATKKEHELYINLLERLQKFVQGN